MEIGEIVMCTVDRIEKTTVFVKIAGGKEGSIVLSEIAPGRIRNLREYVVPKKKIICKVLRITGSRIELSLRRVTQKEQKELREKYKQEKSFKSIFKSILGEKTQEVLKQIENSESIYDFIEEAKENSKKLEKLIGKKESAKILEILKTQKQKKAVLKKEISLTTKNPDGINLLKKILGAIKEASVKYISAGRYSIKIEADDLKKADAKIKAIISDIEAQTKGKNIEFSVKEK